VHSKPCCHFFGLPVVAAAVTADIDVQLYQDPNDCSNILIVVL